MSRIYSNPARADSPHSLPDVEVFEVRQGEWLGQLNYEPGWYWWTCLPGCLPDSDPNGPFATYDEAVADAQDDDYPDQMEEL